MTEEPGRKWREQNKEDYQNIMKEKWEHKKDKKEGNIDEKLEDFIEMIKGTAKGAGNEKKEE